MTIQIPEATRKFIDLHIYDPLKFSAALIKYKGNEWAEPHFSTGLDEVGDLQIALEKSNIRFNKDYLSLPKAVSIFRRVGLALHAPFHLLNSEACSFLEGVKLDKGDESVTLRSELENIVSLLRPNVISLAADFINEAEKYGWKNDNIEPWDNIIAPETAINPNAYKVERNIGSDPVPIERYNKAVGKIFRMVNAVYVRMDSFCNPSSNFDQRYKLSPYTTNDGSRLTMSEIYERLQELGPGRIMREIENAMEVYDHTIALSSNASRTSKDLMVCLKAARGQMEYVADLVRLHARYYERQIFPDSRIIIDKLYENQFGGSIGRGIILSLYCANLLILECMSDIGFMKTYSVEQLQSPSFNEQ